MDRPWSELTCEPPGELPTMISREEASYLAWLGRCFWDATSDVVEVGPWLGGSTWCLATGMASRADRDPDARLHVIDNFRWRSFMSARGPQLEPGSSFRPCFERNVAAFRELIEVHEVRLPDEALGDIELDEPARDYDSELPLLESSRLRRPVQVLFVDGAKSFPAFAHMLRALSPRVAPGALLVLQDFKAVQAYWVPIAVAAMLRAGPGCLAIEHVLPANTIAWRAVEPLEPALNALPGSLADVGAREGLELLDWMAGELEASDDAAGARIVTLAGVPFLAAKDEWPAAARRLRACASCWPLRESAEPIERMRDWLKAKRGRAPSLAVPTAKRRMHRRLARAARHLRPRPRDGTGTSE